MSLTSFIKRPEVRDRIKPLRPPTLRKIPASIRVEPHSSRRRSNLQTVVGAAIDYLLRFDLQRRAPNATARKWVAETAAESLCPRQTVDGVRGHSVPRIAGRDFEASVDALEIADEVAVRAREVVDAARTAVAFHSGVETADKWHLAKIAAHAIRLAKLDPIIRAGVVDPEFDKADPADVEDLLNMLEIVPWDSLVDDETLLLNPTFGESSDMVGGADADLITGDLLIDFKTTTKNTMNGRDLDQLFGYFLLSRNEGKTDPDFPDTGRVGLYFCRHGHLCTWNVSEWAEHPDFSSIEEWFFAHAKSLCAAAS